MFVENKNETTFTVTEAVYVPHLHQAGTVVADEGSMVRVNLTHGGTILLEKGQVQKRTVLLG